MIRWLTPLGACILAVSVVATATGKNTGPVPRECSGAAFSPNRDASNPLALASSPGADPLTGASFFVDGPAHGSAAGAIAKLLGMDPKSFSDSESWQDFDTRIVPSALKKHPGQAHSVHELEKIAGEPETQRFSSFTGGGVPGAITNQTNKIFCGNMKADPNAIPIFQTYFLQPNGKGCSSKSALHANESTFKREVNEFTAGVGRRPVVLLLELDGGALAHCEKGSARTLYESQYRYEVDQTAALPHAVVYAEAGYSDANSPKFTAQVLKAIDISKIRGFFTNDTHLNWTISEVHWADKIIHKLGGGHFIVNTAQNGRGPLRPRNRARHGNEVLCNPPGRGLGPRPTADTGYFSKGVDAWEWTSVPGNSSGHCHGGTASGTFWAARGIKLAERANGKLGPGFPSQPY